MSIKTVTKPPILDETGQDIVAGLTGIANAVQPINIYLDVQMSIPVEGWSATAPHIYNWLYNRITEECGIEVYFMDGAEDVDMKYLEYDKIAGGIRFTIDEIPDAPIPLQVRIINAQTTAVIDPVDSSLVTESAVPGAVNVHEAMENHEERISSNEDSIESIEDKLVEVDNELDLRLKSVNGISGDENGDVIVNETEFTHQIVTDDAQQSTGEFLFRTTGGDASLSDGPAKLVNITGRSVHTGESVETLNMEVNAAERVAPDPITAELDTETFEAYVSGGGVYTIIYTDEWSTDPELYGITITGTPLYGDSISITWDEIADPVMSVFSPRVAPPAITAILNPTVFKAYVAGSGVYTLSYTTEWSEDPALYGVTVSNDPVDGDEIVITYEQSDRGTIVVSNPSKFVSTGWNLYDNSTGKKYAKVKKYSTQYGFLIGGAYASIEFAETIDGARTSISPASGYFAVPADGYVFVTGGDATTYILMTWSDWTEGYEGEFQAYTESVVDLSLIMTQFPYGLMQVGAVADEINFSMMRAISRIERLAYSEANLEYAQSTGRSYEADTNYIYLVKDMEDAYVISETGAYTASDHGIEFVDGDIPVFIETLYGQNLVDKLRTDVLTKSQDLINNLTTNDSTKALSAAQGYALNSKIPQNGVYTSITNANDATDVTKQYMGPDNGTNFPDTSSWAIRVLANDTDHILQLAIKTNWNGTDNRYCVRQKAGNGNWNTWDELALNSKFGKQLGNNVSLSNIDTFTETGFYNAYFENSIVPTAGWGTLEVHNTDGTIVQIITCESALRTRRYYRNTSTWGAFTDFALNSKINNFLVSKVTSGSMSAGKFRVVLPQGHEYAFHGEVLITSYTSGSIERNIDVIKVWRRGTDLYVSKSLLPNSTLIISSASWNTYGIDFETNRSNDLFISTMFGD